MAMPALDLTFSLAVIAPLIVGFVVGLLVKKVIKIGVLLAILVLILIGLGVLAPNQVIQPLLSLVKSGPALASKVKEVSSYLPYSSVTFLIGLAVGFYKG